jgi:hypothetical protein
MNSDSIYKHQPYFFEIEKDQFDNNGEIVKSILSKVPIEGKDVSISFLASNYNHDVYKAVVDGQFYCVKYSLDPNNVGLKTEFDVIKRISNNCSCKAFHYGQEVFGEKIHYLVSSYENGESLKNSGTFSFMNNIDEFFFKYSLMQKEEVSISSFNSYINNFLNSVNLDEFPEDGIEAMSTHTDIEIIRETIKSIELEILSFCKPKVIKKNQLCHGKLKPSNILFKNETFKFIDFTEAYLGNVYLDIAGLCIYYGFDEEKEKFVLDKFMQNNGINQTEDQYTEYEVCSQIMRRKIFLDILTDYLKEVYVFSSSRPMRIAEIINLFAMNSKKFFRIPAVNKHYEFLYKCILEPISLDS